MTGVQLRIPTNLDSDSEPNWTRIPEQTGQSERSDAGFFWFYSVDVIGVKFLSRRGELSTVGRQTALLL